MSLSKKIVLFSLKKVYSNGILSKIKSEVGIHFDGNADTPTPGKVERLCFESSSDVCLPVTNLVWIQIRRLNVSFYCGANCCVRKEAHPFSSLKNRCRYSTAWCTDSNGIFDIVEGIEGSCISLPLFKLSEQKYITIGTYENNHGI